MSDIKFEKSSKEALKEWSKAAPDLYDRLTSIKLEWPTLCAQWCLEASEKNNALISTFTLRQEPEYIREVEINSKLTHPEYVKKQFDVPGSANLEADPVYESFAVLFLAQSHLTPNVVAALADTGKLSFYLKSKPSQPTATFAEHTESGAGLAWSPSDASLLVSGSVDGKVVLWKVNPEELQESHKIAVFNANEAINEITWTHSDKIVVALESGKVLVLGSDSLSLTSKIDISNYPVNSASLSPFSANLLAAGDDGGSLFFYDIRHSSPEDGLLYSIKKHEGKLTHVRWSPHIDGVLASGGIDGMVILYDLRKIGLTSAQDDNEMLEVIFKHLGHIDGNQVTALEFHPHIPMQLLSCDEKCKLMVWQIKKNLYSDEGFKKISF